MVSLPLRSDAESWDMGQMLTPTMIYRRSPLSYLRSAHKHIPTPVRVLGSPKQWCEIRDGSAREFPPPRMHTKPELWCQIGDGFPREFPPPRAYCAGAACPWARRFGVQLTDTQLRRSVREVGEILEGTRPRSGITGPELRLLHAPSSRHAATA